MTQTMSPESKGPHRVGGALLLSENRPGLGGRKPSSPYSFVALTRNNLDGRVAHSLSLGGFFDSLADSLAQNDWERPPLSFQE